MTNTPKTVPTQTDSAPAHKEEAPADIRIPIAEPDRAHKEPLDIKKLEAMKDDLKKIIDAMNQGSSYLSRAAKFWNEIPLWQKVAGGLALTVPLFLLTALFQSVVLLCINVFTLIAYTTGSFLLDNHTSQNLDRTQNLKKGIDGLADLLIGTITLLDKIGADLGIETTKLTGENEKLTANVGHLGEGVSSLNEENTLLHETRLDIGKVKDSLATQVENLRLTFVQQKKASDDALTQLSDTRSLYSADQVKFSAELVKLQQLNEKATRDATNLQGCLATLSSSVGLNEEARKKFDEKLNAMINDSTVSFTSITGQLTEHVKQLNETAAGHKELNGRQADLQGVYAAQNEAIIEQNQTLLDKYEASLNKILELTKLQTIKNDQLDAQLAAGALKDKELEGLRAEIQRRDAESEQLRASGLALVKGRNGLFGLEVVKGDSGIRNNISSLAANYK